MLIGFRRPSVVFYPTFSVFQSILVVLYAVIGGIGYVIGALVGAALAPGAIVPYAFGDLFDSAQAVQLTLGIVVFGVLLVVPNGLASLVTKLRLGMQRSARARARGTSDDHVRGPSRRRGCGCASASSTRSTACRSPCDPARCSGSSARTARASRR